MSNKTSQLGRFFFFGEVNLHYINTFTSRPIHNKPNIDFYTFTCIHIGRIDNKKTKNPSLPKKKCFLKPFSTLP